MQPTNFDQQLAQALGLRADGASGGLYGTWEGWPVAVYAPDARYPRNLVVTVSAVRPGEPLTQDDCRQFRKEHKPAVRSLVQQGTLLTMAIRPGSRAERLQQDLRDGLSALTGWLRAGGFRPCCQSCGKSVDTAVCVVGGARVHLCPDCFDAVRQDTARRETVRAQQPENVAGGLVGAVLGSLAGVLCIVLLSRLGLVAAVSGLVMAVGTLKGYEKLGGRLSTKGVVLCMALMLVMTYVGDRADWAVVAVQELGLDFFTAFRAVPLLLELGAIEHGPYWANLIMLYAFMLLGAIPTVIAAVRSRKNAGVVYRLGETEM